MEKHIIDIGKLSIKKKNILKYLHNYSLIIFDLDNTIFPLYYYDKIIFKHIAKELSTKLKINRTDLYNFLIYKKFVKKTNKKLFNLFIKHFKLSNKISEKRLVKFYQYYSKISNFNPPSIIDILKKIKNKKKKLMLITEGNSVRQKNKIKSLGIEKLFDYIIILDGKYNRKYKPSTNGIKKFLKIIKMNSSIYLGDTHNDKKLSSLLGSKFYYFDISKFIKFKK